MQKFYTDEKNVQVILALLKKHNIKRAIVSPGSANSPLAAGLQGDPFFEAYSAVDERSAAYMACGMSEETCEPVLLSCTGATASRNYLPGLTEAFYRKLPLIVITSTQPISRVGHLVAQVVDRSVMPKDTVRASITLPIIKDEEDHWECEIKVNQAILESRRGGSGPVHINLQTNSLKSYSAQVLPTCRMIKLVDAFGDFPSIARKKIAFFVGSHRRFSQVEIDLIDSFCYANNAVVFCDHTSGYNGKYKILNALVAGQRSYTKKECRPDLLIHIGEVSGDYYGLKVGGVEVWRVSLDGAIRDTFRSLTHVFEMPLASFLAHYTEYSNGANSDGYLHECSAQLARVRGKLPELPLSNLWLASKMAHKIPEGACIHFGILNSLRSWNFFELPRTVTSMSNVGGFGIDGVLSAAIGASYVNREKLVFCVIGDLAFFYDMNALGNRHVGNNLRILLVNNGKGTEFRQYNHHTSHFGDAADEFIAAAGHFGQKSPTLVKHYAQDLGFEYISASSKDEFESVYEKFLAAEVSDRSIVFEVFTDGEQESKALELAMNLDEDPRSKAKGYAKQIIGKGSTKFIKRIVG